MIAACFAVPYAAGSQVGGAGSARASDTAASGAPDHEAPQPRVSAQLAFSVCHDVLVNGTFEAGPDAGWVLETDAVDWRSREPVTIDDVILHNRDFEDGDMAAEGEWLAMLGGGPDYEMALYQDKGFDLLPESQLVSATLRYAFAFDSEEWLDGRPDDLFAAYLVDQFDTRRQIEGTGVSEEELPAKAWFEIAADVTDLLVEERSDDTVRVMFLSLNSEFDPTWHLLDAVSLEVCQYATPSPTPLPSSTPRATSTPAPSATPEPPLAYLPALQNDRGGSSAGTD